MNLKTGFIPWLAVAIGLGVFARGLRTCAAFLARQGEGQAS